MSIAPIEEREEVLISRLAFWGDGEENSLLNWSKPRKVRSVPRPATATFPEMNGAFSSHINIIADKWHFLNENEKALSFGRTIYV